MCPPRAALASTRWTSIPAAASSSAADIPGDSSADDECRAGQELPGSVQGRVTLSAALATAAARILSALHAGAAAAHGDG